MATLTIEANGGGVIDAFRATYADALAGLGTGVLTNSFLLGQSKPSSYQVDEGFLSFDTSAVGALDPGAVVDSVVLGLYGRNDASTTDFVLECAPYDWSSGGLTTADWLDTSELATLASSIVATRDTASGWSTAAYNDLTGDLSAVIQPAGTTYLALWSQRTRNATTPTGNEYVRAWGPDDATRKPRLVVTYHIVAATTRSFAAVVG